MTKAIKKLTEKQLNDIKLTITKQGIHYFRAPDFNLAALVPMLTDQRLAIIFESSFNEQEIIQQEDVKDYDKLRFGFWIAICQFRQLKQHYLSDETEFLQLIKQVDFQQITSIELVKKYQSIFGQVPLLYDRNIQLEGYLYSLTPTLQNKLRTQCNNQPLLMLKIYELENTFKTILYFELITDSDSFSRQKTIHQIQKLIKKQR